MPRTAPFVFFSHQSARDPRGAYAAIRLVAPREGWPERRLEVPAQAGDGGACAGDTKPITLCGACGILSDSSYPTGVKMLAQEPVVEAIA